MALRDRRRVRNAVLVLLAAVQVVTGTLEVSRGTSAIPGAPDRIDATTDSQLRFFTTWWLCSALVTLRALRSPATAGPSVRWLCATMLLGGVARLAAWRNSGRPHPLFATLTAVELAGPPAMYALQRSIERDERRAEPSR